MNKGFLREILIKKRDHFKVDYSDMANKRIYWNIINSSIYKNSKNVFCFLSFGSELNTWPIAEKILEDGKNLIVPYTEDNMMFVCKIDSLDDLVVGNFNIYEPKLSKRVLFDYTKLDLVITPCVASNLDNYRIGYGGGYFDKFFVLLPDNISKVCLCYDKLRINYDFYEDHDKQVNYVLTEKGFYDKNRVLHEMI